MKYTIEFSGDVLVVVSRGPWTGGIWTTELHDEVKSHMDQGIRKVLIDFEKASVASSAGVGVLMAIRTSLLNAGGTLKLCKVTRRVRRSLVVAGILSLFDIYETREEALRAFEEVPA